MNVDISSAAPLVPAITSNHLGKIPAGLFLFWHNFVIKQLLFTQTGAGFGVAHVAAGGEGDSVIYLLDWAQCASWEGKISRSGAFVNGDGFGRCPGLGWLAPGSVGSVGSTRRAPAPDQCGMPTVWTLFHCLLSCPGLLSGVSAPTCALSSGT